MKYTLKKTDNALIINRRRKKAIRRTVVFSILLISLLVILCLELSYFNVTNIIVHGNKIVSTDEIETSSIINKGTNIFKLNLKNIRTNIQHNPYILNANIKRKLPSSIIITVDEREAVFYTENDIGYLVIDKKGIVLEQREDISKMKLTYLQGFNTTDFKVGSAIPVDSTRKLQAMEQLTEFITDNSSGIDITSVDLADLSNIRVYCNEMVIKLGSSDNIKNKLYKALYIIESNNLISSKGYVDISFEGNPVVNIEESIDKK